MSLIFSSQNKVSIDQHLQCICAFYIVLLYALTIIVFLQSFSFLVAFLIKVLSLLFILLFAACGIIILL